MGDLGDVTITNPRDDQRLTYNGTVWVNEDLPDGIIYDGLITADNTQTTILFDDLPSGWRRITLTMTDLKFRQARNLLVQFGDAGGIETDGYKIAVQPVGSNTAVTNSAGIQNK